MAARSGVSGLGLRGERQKAMIRGSAFDVPNQELLHG
jgi:hypothetical protein